MACERCAKLRAALAGAVFFTGDVDDAASLEAELKARIGMWFFTEAEKHALEVLRETAGEVRA